MSFDNSPISSMATSEDLSNHENDIFSIAAIWLNLDNGLYSGGRHLPRAWVAMLTPDLDYFTSVNDFRFMTLLRVLDSDLVIRAYWLTFGCAVNSVADAEFVAAISKLPGFSGRLSRLLRELDGG